MALARDTSTIDNHTSTIDNLASPRFFPLDGPADYNYYAVQMGSSTDRPIGIMLLTGAFVVAGLVGIAAGWAAWPRNANTSPLAALFALTSSCICLLTAILVWRRSRLAPTVFLAAIALLLFPASFIAPGVQLFAPSLIVILPVAFLGHRYLRKARPPGGWCF